jgi:peptidoglycan/LPS O-acetylase OafA/YrhL
VNEMFPLNIPSWSLFFELLVNLLFVMSWPLLTARRLVAISVLTGSIVGLAIVHKGSIDQGSIASSFPVGVARTVFGFCVGILIARQTRSGPREQSNLKVLAIVSVVGVALAGRPAGGIRAIWDAACVLVVFPLLVYSATLVDPGPRLRRVATFLGVTSYAVYVLHSPLASILNSAGRYFAAGTGAPYLGIAVLFVLLTGCWLVDLYFDVPIRRQLARRVPRIEPLRSPP